MFFLSMILGLAMMATTPATTLPSEGLTLEYSRLQRIAERLRFAAKYDRVIVLVRARATNNELPADKLEFTVASTTGTRVLKPDANGFLSIPDDAALAKENPPVRVNLPKEAKVSFNIVIRCRLPNAASVAYADIAGCLTQVNDGIADKAGLMTFMAPSAVGVRLRCGADCVATLTGATPDTVRADKDGNIELLHATYRKVPGLVVALSAPLVSASPIIRR